MRGLASNAQLGVKLMVLFLSSQEVLGIMGVHGCALCQFHCISWEACLVLMECFPPALQLTLPITLSQPLCPMTSPKPLTFSLIILMCKMRPFSGLPKMAIARRLGFGEQLEGVCGQKLLEG